MALFKSKEKRKRAREEHKQKLLNEFLQNKNLQELNETDRGFANAVNESLEDVTGHARGKEGEMAQVEMMNILVEQNWLIIRLLNEISQKLDK